MSRIEKVLTQVGLGVVAKSVHASASNSPFVYDPELKAWVRVEEATEGHAESSEFMSEDQSDLWLTW